MENNIKTKLIFTPLIARRLLKLGCRIVDIKPDKTDTTHKKTIFIFEDDENFQKNMSIATRRDENT